MKQRKQSIIVIRNKFITYAYPAYPVQPRDSGDTLQKLIPNHPDGHAFDLEVESDLAGYLGVELQTEDDGSLSMTQYHLTKRIIEALGLQDAN